MKRVTVLLLALLMIATLFLTSCNNTTTTTSTPDSVSTDASESSNLLVPHLGERRFDGKTLKVLTIAEDVAFSKLQFKADPELQDEPVNVAAYERNNLLEINYGFKIDAEFEAAFDSFEGRVENDYASGTGDYSVLAAGIQTTAFIAQKGYLLDIYGLKDSNINFEGNWWDREINEDISIINRLYFTAGDILIMDDEYTRCIFYNKDIAEENDLGDINSMVINKQWDMDTLHEMSTTAAREDGDGIRTDNLDDVWGFVSAAFDTYSLILGADCPQVIKNDDDVPVLNMLADRNTEVFFRVHDFMTDTTCVAYTEQYGNWQHPDTVQNFYRDKALFFVGTIANVNGEALRNAEFRYGILPMPLYDENQEKYATTINPYHFQSISIVGTTPDEEIDFITFALEAMAYTSKKMVTPEYYDLTLKTKRFPDDDDSPEILDIIFSNRVADISVIFNWDDCIQYYNQLVVKESPDLASHIGSKADAFNAALQKTIAVFEGMD